MQNKSKVILIKAFDIASNTNKKILLDAFFLLLCHKMKTIPSEN